VRCSLETQTNCPIDDEQNYGIWWLNLFNIASVEAMLFVVMGLTKVSFLVLFLSKTSSYFYLFCVGDWHVLVAIG